MLETVVLLPVDLQFVAGDFEERKILLEGEIVDKVQKTNIPGYLQGATKTLEECMLRARHYKAHNLFIGLSFGDNILNIVAL